MSKIRDFFTKKRFHFSRLSFHAIIMVYFLLGMFSAIVGGMFVFSNYGGSVHDRVGCDGIDLCYSGESFIRDVYCVGRESNYSARTPPKPPYQLFNEGGDCESESNAIMCLCDRYNETCVFYQDLSVNAVEPEDSVFCLLGACLSGHMGIRFKEVDGNWRTLN